jgi:hypothetical protein
LFTGVYALQGIEPLLDNLFSFLRRKTDFFVGATPDMIEETVMGVLKKHSVIAAKDKADKEKKAAKEKEDKLKKQRALEKKKVHMVFAVLASCTEYPVVVYRKRKLQHRNHSPRRRPR